MSASQIIRQPWVRWVIRFVGVALILYLGMTVRQLRTEQQEARGLAGSLVWSSVRYLGEDVKTAADQLQQENGDAAVASLRKVEQHLAATNYYLPLYYAVSPDGSASLTRLLGAYENEAERLAYTINLAPALHDPAFGPEVMVLHADLEQWNTAFTQELLTRGTPTQLRAAVQAVCQNIQAPEIRKDGC